jgi:hypothetical protein
MNGWYDRSLLQFREIKGTTTVAACGPPGGGRNKVLKFIEWINYIYTNI